MSHSLLILDGPETRQLAISWIEQSPLMTRVEFKGPRRSLSQSDKMWACLTDISVQIKWHGQYLSPNHWKLLFMDDLCDELHIVPALNGKGFVNLARNSSDLKAAEMSVLIDRIMLFVDEHHVRLSKGVRP